MAYQAGFLKDRVTIQNKVSKAEFGGTTRYTDVATVWANVAFNKGMKAMHEGALDAYDTVMVRMRWNSNVNRDSLLVHGGVTYQILSFNASWHNNEIQITACELVQGQQAKKQKER